MRPYRARFVRPAALLVLLASLVPAVASPAPARAAGPAPDHGEGVAWEPYRSRPFTSPAGQTCDFTLRGEPVVDEEMIATWSRYPDGSPRLQTIKGELRVRYTNLGSGASTVYDLSGVGTIHHHRDGGNTFYLHGPVAVGFRPGDAYPRDFYAMDGFHVVYTAPERTYREMRVDAGSEHNICEDLD